MRRKIHKVLLLSLCSLIACLTSSCAFAGFKDIDKRFFVMAIGVDPSKQIKNGFRITLKLAVPSSEKAGSGEAVLVSQDSRSITEAIRLMKSKVDKELDFGHTKVIVFNKQVMTDHMDQTLDWFTRRRDIQLVAWVGIGSPSAEEVMKVKTKTERLAANALILAFSKEGTESEFITPIYLFDFVRRIHEHGIDPLLPIIEAKEDYLVIDKAALFDKHKLKMVLNPEETKWLNIIRGETTKAELKINERNKYFLVSADDLNLKHVLRKSQSKKADLHTKGTITCLIEESKEDITMAALDSYGRLAEKTVEDKIIKVITKLQKAGLDPIGFGQRYQARGFLQRREWSEWQQNYKDMAVTADVKVQIMSSGMTK
jgi:spore germination protein KC